MKQMYRATFRLYRSLVVAVFTLVQTNLIGQVPPSPNVPSFELPSVCYNNIRVPLNDDCEAVVNVGLLTNANLPDPIAAECSDNIPRYTADSVKIAAFSMDEEVPGQICEGDPKFNGGQQGVTDVCPEITDLLQDTVYGEGEWMYGIYLWDDEKDCWELTCWGNFFTEDKTDPLFIGDTSGVADIANTVTDESVFRQYGTYQRVEYLTWQAELASGTDFRPGLTSCWQSTNNAELDYTWPDDSLRLYDTIKILPTTSGVLTVMAASAVNTNETDNEAVFDPALAIYDESFDETNPCQNMIAFAQSTFIPNPLAGLGFANGTQNSSIAGAIQDSADIFAPWLLHNHPIARIDLKVMANKAYYVVVTHREGEQPDITDDEAFVYFVMIPYNGQIQPDSMLETDYDEFYSDSLIADTSFAYFEFLCSDLEEVMLDNQHTVAHTVYTGGTLYEISDWLLNDTAYRQNTLSNRGNVAVAWKNLVRPLVGMSASDLAQLDFSDSHINGANGLRSGWFNRSSVDSGQAFFDSLFYQYGLMPPVIENCNDWEVKITDRYQAYGDCGVDMEGYDALDEGLNVSGIITRTFVVSDAGSKTDKDTAKIQLTPKMT